VSTGPVALAPRRAEAAPGTVASLRAGDRVDAVFACTRKDRLATRAGAPYLALELRDRSGAMACSPDASNAGSWSG